MPNILNLRNMNFINLSIISSKKFFLPISKNNYTSAFYFYY